MDEFLGVIKLFAGNFAPEHWMFCHGQILPINSNTALFSLLGTMYGGDGTRSFALPDLRSRVPVGAGQGVGLSDYQQGEQGGAERVTLNVNQMPTHIHTATVRLNAAPNTNITDVATNNVFANETQGGKNTPTNYSPNANSTQLRADAATAVVQPSGGSQAHENRQPYLGLNYIICVQGHFPPRS